MIVNVSRIDSRAESPNVANQNVSQVTVIVPVVALSLEFPHCHVYRVNMSLETILDLEALPTVLTGELVIFLVYVSDVVKEGDGLHEFHVTKSVMDLKLWRWQLFRTQI